ncbi:MAG: hypothetical protein HXY38_03870 [Chloroflexi bacterium]|nr:hypothetical protein [Chloroflexota bacterium]
MKTFKNIIATIFAILFVITAVMALLLFNFDRHAFAAETYQQAFAREDFYNKIPSLLAQSIVSGTDPTQQLLGMQGLTQETWEGFFRTLLPPNVLKPIGDDVLHSTFAYLNLESNSIEVDLSPVKTSMLGETGAQAALVLIQSLPACTIDQAAMIMFGMLSGDQIQLCNPPEDMLPMLMPIIQGQMQAAAAIVPDRLTLVTAPPQSDPREQIQTLRLFMRLSLLLPIACLLALTVFAVRSGRDWLNWWGISLAITGFIAFVIGILGAPIFSIVIESALASQLPDYLPTFLLDFTKEFTAAMAQALLTPVVLQGIALTFIGVCMAGLGYYLSHKQT